MAWRLPVTKDRAMEFLPTSQGQAGSREHTVEAEREWQPEEADGPGLANKFKQAVSNKKCFLPTYPFFFTYFSSPVS